jgi:hypothetical protein
MSPNTAGPDVTGPEIMGSADRSLFCLDCSLSLPKQGSRLREVAVLDADFIGELFAPDRQLHFCCNMLSQDC